MSSTTDWTYSASLKKYRQASTGRFLSAAAVADLRDRFVDARTRVVEQLAADLADGTIGPTEWHQEMMHEVALVTQTEYTFGRGGTHALTLGDQQTINRIIATQHTFLEHFADQVRAEELSAAQVRARAALYVRSARAAHGVGQSAAHGLTLPQHPGDGQTACLSNCRCHLDITEDDTAWRVEWVVDRAAEHCDDCLAMADEWAPLVVPKT